MRLRLLTTLVAGVLLAVAVVNVSAQESGGQAASAMAQFERVAGVFDQVPLFYFVNDQGSAVVISMTGGAQVVPVFLQPEGAARFGRQRLPSGQADQFSLDIMSLGQFYRYRIEQQQGNSDTPNFTLVAEERDISVAQRITGDSSFSSVPVFAARLQSSGGFLTVQRDGRAVMPLFLEARMLESMLQNIADSDPAMGQDLGIEVIPLERVINDIVNGNIPANQTQFVVPQASMDFIRANQQ